MVSHRDRSPAPVGDVGRLAQVDSRRLSDVRFIVESKECMRVPMRGGYGSFSFDNQFGEYGIISARSFFVERTARVNRTRINLYKKKYSIRTN